MDILEQIKIIIKKAGQETLNYYHLEDLKVDYKEPEIKDSPLTQADLASERIILENLKSFNYGILSEETSEENNRLEKDLVFIIDPLDGTKDFIQKTDEFTIMIGLAKAGVAILGAVYQPATDILYFAEQGKGAFKQIGDSAPVKINVSSKQNFAEMRLLASRNHLKDKEVQFAKKVNLNDFVQCGSAGLKVCKVAEGIGDIYMNTSDKTSEWDLCAADIILKESGGTLTDINGQTIIYNKKDPRNYNGYIASNGKLHNKILTNLNELPTTS